METIGNYEWVLAGITFLNSAASFKMFLYMLYLKGIKSLDIAIVSLRIYSIIQMRLLLKVVTIKGKLSGTILLFNV